MSDQPESQLTSGSRKGKERESRKSSIGGSPLALTSSRSLPTFADGPAAIPYRRKKPTFTKEVTEFLKSWIIEHSDYPYPNEREKRQLSEITGLSGVQITNWMINARRRIPLLLQPRITSTSIPNAQSDLHSETATSSQWSTNTPSFSGPSLRPILPMANPTPISSYSSPHYLRIRPQSEGMSNTSQLHINSSSSIQPAPGWIQGSQRTQDRLFVLSHAAYNEGTYPQHTRTQRIPQSDVHNSQQRYYSDQGELQPPRHLQPNETNTNIDSSSNFEHRDTWHG